MPSTVSRSSISSSSASDRAAYFRFVALVARRVLLMGVAAAPLFLGYAGILRSAGELLMPADLAARSRSAPMLWLSGYYDAGVLKPSIARRLRPKILVIGSSRVMQFRAEMFTSPEAFYNLGRPAVEVTDLSRDLATVVDGGAIPEFVVTAPDWWWFQRSALDPPRGAPTLAEFAQRWFRFTLDQLQLVQHAWRDARFWRTLRDRGTPEAESGRILVGVGAHQSNSGYRNDGSYRWGQRGSTIEARRQEGLTRFRRGLYHGSIIDEGAVAALGEFLDDCRRRSIPTVVFLPPVDGSVLDTFERDPDVARFWRDFPGRIRSVSEQHGAAFFDFSDPRHVGLTEDEFIDWFHASDVAYARMLLMMRTDPAGARILGRFVDPARLESLLANARQPYKLTAD